MPRLDSPLHPQLRNVTFVATKVHVILRSFVVLAWMCEIPGEITVVF